MNFFPSVLSLKASLEYRVMYTLDGKSFAVCIEWTVNEVVSDCAIEQHFYMRFSNDLIDVFIFSVVWFTMIKMRLYSTTMLYSDGWMEKLARMLMENGNRPEMNEYYIDCCLYSFITWKHALDAWDYYMFSVIKCFYANVLRCGWIYHCHFDVHMNLNLHDLYLLSMFWLVCLCVSCVCSSVCVLECFFGMYVVWVFVCMNVCYLSSKFIQFLHIFGFTWKTVTKAQSNVSKFFRSHSVSSSTALLSQNLHPNSVIPRILFTWKKIFMIWLLLLLFLFLVFHTRATHTFSLCLSVLTNGFGVFCIV